MNIRHKVCYKHGRKTHKKRFMYWHKDRTTDLTQESRSKSKEAIAYGMYQTDKYTHTVYRCVCLCVFYKKVPATACVSCTWNGCFCQSNQTYQKYDPAPPSSLFYSTTLDSVLASSNISTLPSLYKTIGGLGDVCKRNKYLGLLLVLSSPRSPFFI